MQCPWPALPHAVVLSAVVLAVVAVGGLRPQPALAQTSESIDGYLVAIAIQRDGTLQVVEDIDYDFGTNVRHGIVRDIPTELPYDRGHERVYRLKNVTVSGSTDTPTKLSIEHPGGGITRLRIGDAQRTITGQHHYRIAYRVEGALNGFADHDELYWNAIGAQWPVPIAQLAVGVALPGGGAPTQSACFAGATGSLLPCGSPAGERQTVFQPTGLSAYQGVTVVVGLPKGLVAEPRPILRSNDPLMRAFGLDPLRGAIIALECAAIAGALGWLIWKEGRDRRWHGSAVEVAFGGTQGEEPVPLLEHDPVAIEFTPPDNLRPGQIGTLLDEAVHPLDAAATVIDLANRGYLTLEDVPRTETTAADWRITRVARDAAGTGRKPLLPYERGLLDGMFNTEDVVLLSTLQSAFYTTFTKFEDALYSDAMTNRWFLARPDAVRDRWWAIGAGVTTFAAVATAVATLTPFALFGVPVILGGVALFLLHGRMPRRTAQGYGELRRVLGFREYIASAERRRAEFAEKAGLFYDYLPFAIVFGYVDRWGKTFEGLVQQPPAWYRGQALQQPGGTYPLFNSALFAGSLGGFANSMVSAAVAVPGVAGASGFMSGGFGGGFSGGGGGGGGGGSW